MENIILLAGAGHAHLSVLSRAAEFRESGIDLVLVSPRFFRYSGMATGVIGGLYAAEENRIDVRALAEKRGVLFKEGKITEVDRRARRVRLDSGEALHYAALSWNIGSKVRANSIPGAAQHAFAVKPLDNLVTLRRSLESRSLDAGTARITVVGAGATGSEIAVNLEALARRMNTRAAITVLSPAGKVLNGSPDGAARAMLEVFRSRGVALKTGRAVEIRRDSVILEDGSRLASEFTVLATGLRASRIPGLPGSTEDKENGLRVNAFLQSTEDPRIFGSGDCVHFEGRPLPKLGVYAVRQAPCLAHNLRAFLEGRKLKAYRPQKRALSILNLGDGTGLALWGNFYWRSRLMMKLKDRIDRTFLGLYR